jgi:hypothetical protein
MSPSPISLAFPDGGATGADQRVARRGSTGSSGALGYFGGAAFEDNFWLPMLIAAGASIVLGAGGELLRRKVLDRGRDRGRRVGPTAES